MAKSKNKGNDIILVVLFIIIIVLLIYIFRPQGNKQINESSQSSSQSESSIINESSFPESSSRPESSAEESREEESSEEETSSSSTQPVFSAQEVLMHLKNKDLDALQGFLSQDGLILSPLGDYSTNTVIIEKSNFSSAWLASEDQILFGAYPGSGEDILLTAEKYYDAFIWPADFLQGAKEIPNDPSLENAFSSVCPDARYITYHIEDVFEWKKLTLIITEENGEEFLRGIVFRDIRSE